MTRTTNSRRRLPSPIRRTPTHATDGLRHRLMAPTHGYRLDPRADLARSCAGSLAAPPRRCSWRSHGWPSIAMPLTRYATPPTVLYLRDDHAAITALDSIGEGSSLQAKRRPCRLNAEITFTYRMKADLIGQARSSRTYVSRGELRAGAAVLLDAASSRDVAWPFGPTTRRSANDGYCGRDLAAVPPSTPVVELSAHTRKSRQCRSPIHSSKRSGSSPVRAPGGRPSASPPTRARRPPRPRRIPPAVHPSRRARQPPLGLRRVAGAGGSAPAMPAPQGLVDRLVESHVLAEQHAALDRSRRTDAQARPRDRRGGQRAPSCAAHAAGDPSLVALQPALHLLEGRLDQLAELHECDLDALGMGDQVTLAARAEHDGLRSSQLPKLYEEHQDKKQRNHRHPSGCQRGDAGSRCEVIGHA